MDELGEGLFKGVLRLIGLVIRCLIWIVWELGYETICWCLGWPVCRLATFGALPKEHIRDHDKASGLTQFIVSLIGFVLLVVIASVIAKYAGEITFFQDA